MTKPALPTAPETTTSEALQWLVADLPLRWIHESLVATATASERERRLPAHLAVLLVVAMGLFRDRSIADVANDLELARQREGDDPIASNAISGARKRLGEEPLRHLAARCAEEWAVPSAVAHPWRGLTLFGLDGSTMRVPDSDENRAFFGGQSGTSGSAPQFGPAMAAAMLASVPAILVFLALQRSFVRGVTQSGIKG